MAVLSIPDGRLSEIVACCRSRAVDMTGITNMPIAHRNEKGDNLERMTTSIAVYVMIYVKYDVICKRGADVQ